jgi:hypothetical protein
MFLCESYTKNILLNVQVFQKESANPIFKGKIPALQVRTFNRLLHRSHKASQWWHVDNDKDRCREKGGGWIWVWVWLCTRKPGSEVRGISSLINTRKDYSR